MNHSIKKTILFMVISTFCFASLSLLVKVTSSNHPFTVSVLFRSIIGFILLYTYFKIRRFKIYGKNLKLLITRGILGFIAIALFFYTLTKLHLGVAVVLNFSSPVFVAIFSPLFLREKFHPALPFLILFALFGASLIMDPDFSKINFTCLLGLLSAVFAGLAYVCLKKLTETDSPETIVLYFSGICSILSIPLFIASPSMPSFSDLPALIGIGILATLAQIFLSYALQYERAAVVSAFSYITTLFSFIFGVTFFNEIPSFASIIGTIIIVSAGIIIAYISEREVHAKITGIFHG